MKQIFGEFMGRGYNVVAMRKHVRTSETLPGRLGIGSGFNNDNLFIPLFIIAVAIVTWP